MGKKCECCGQSIPFTTKEVATLEELKTKIKSMPVRDRYSFSWEVTEDSEMKPHTELLVFPSGTVYDLVDSAGQPAHVINNSDAIGELLLIQNGVFTDPKLQDLVAKVEKSMDSEFEAATDYLVEELSKVIE